MAMECQYQTETFTKKIANLSAQSVVEVKFSVDEGEAVAAYPQISLNSCEVSSGRINYGGRLVVTLVYTDGDGNLCRAQKGAEFSHFCDSDDLAPAQRGECVLTCKKCTVKREGSLIVVSVIADAQITVFDNAQRSFISEIEGAVCRPDTAKFLSPVNFSGESEVDDEFDCVASDVLVPSADILVLDCRAKSGAVEISGEIYLSLLAVRDGMPISLYRTVPYKCEIVCEEAVLACRAYCRAEIKNISVNCKVNEDTGKCGVDFNASLSFFGHYFDEEEITFVSDAFMTDKRLDLRYSEESVCGDDDIKVYTERVTGPCVTKAKVDYTCSFLATALPKAEFSRNAEGIEGSINAVLLYEQGGEVRSTEVETPFAVTLSGISAGCDKIEIAVCGVSIRQRAEGECECEATLKITAADGETRSVRYISEAVEGEEKANPELKFPLTGKERILIYRKMS